MSVIELKGRTYIEIGKQLYITCSLCNKLIRVNKPILGSLHFCITDEEVKQKVKK